MNDHAKEQVLVTGASGYIALHVILQLLKQGYKVRGTLRTPAREAGIREALAKHGNFNDQLSFVKTDLTSDEGWDEAVAGCTYVHHIASPIVKEPPKNDDDLIIPAKEGALRVLRAAAKAGVKRVVMTSSVAAIVYGHNRDGSLTFNEDYWTDLSSSEMGAYERSKTIAETAAWEYMKGEGGAGGMEFATINPGFVLGPMLDADSGVSLELIRKLMVGEMPGLPKLGWAVVDVRDVASAHVAAMTVPEAAGKRFLCSQDHMWVEDIANGIRDYAKTKGYKVPSMKIPAFVLKIVGLFDKTIRMILHELGKRQDIDNSRIRQVLNWQPHDMQDTLKESVDSLVKFKVV
ncbi:MAG: aldehyde reductase [Sphingomonadales bacterium]|jgi:dihydroflavonol-4-reductase